MTSKIPIELTVEQQNSVTAPESKVLVVAGPGSGKTMVLVNRINHLIVTGADPQSIAVVTFTTAVARELRSRISQKLGFVGTLHSLCLSWVRRYQIELGFVGALTVLAQDQSHSLLKQCADDMLYRGTMARLFECLASGPDVSGNEPEALVVKRYFAQCSAGGMIDFDSLLWYGLRILQNGLKTGIAHLLVDEIQDATSRDMDIYQSIPGASKFFVGDADQSIFGFRGACVKYMLMLSQNPAWSTYVLEGNFRSGSAIVKAAERLINHNRQRISKTMKSCNGGVGLVTIVPGIVPAIEFPVSRNESIAILCRYNRTADQIAASLKTAGVQTVERKPREDENYRIARKLLAAVSAPLNDWAVLSFIEEVKGAASANELRNQASKHFSLVNDFVKIPDNLRPQDLVDHSVLVHEGVRSIIADVVARLPEDATVADMCVIMDEERFTATESGAGIFIGTIHSAKGREWDHVILPDWLDGEFPKRKNEFEEERRLAYVALTRARERITFVRRHDQVANLFAVESYR